MGPLGLGPRYWSPCGFNMYDYNLGVDMQETDIFKDNKSLLPMGHILWECYGQFVCFGVFYKNARHEKINF